MELSPAVSATIRKGGSYTPAMGTRDEHGSRPPASAEETITRAYSELASRLRVISQRKFHIPEEDAEAVVNTVFEAYLRRRTTVHDLEKYLVASVCNASRDYWRAKKDTDQMPLEAEDLIAPATADAEERLVRSLTIAVQLTRLGDECCEALCLFHLGGFSAREIAEKLGTTEQNTWQILSKCRRQAKELLACLMEGKT